jgi:3-deoxy-7-phosphoheptulonate synthase
MSFSYLRKIPEPADIAREIPVTPQVAAIKQSRDAAIRAVIEGKDERFLVIVGPCSAHDEEAVTEFVGRLARVNEQTQQKLLIIPRIYTNKPRTLGTGYKGMLHQPDPQKEENIVEGIKALRRMHLRAINESGLTAADEMLYPTNHPYLEDLLSYVAIGARSSENQQHRITASGIDIAVGMKNPVCGDIAVMLNSVNAAQVSHIFTYNGWEVETSGNPLAHCILRGAVNQFGHNIPNYHFEDLIALHQDYAKRSIVNPSVIIDVNHSNSAKRFEQQPRIVMEVLQSCMHAPQLRSLVKGVMIESYLVEGAQSADGATYGQSITDPCLGWEATEKLLLDIADSL